ncbi:MAG: hypothetical protein IPM54_10975 [Polyangiaceae bacterium]|nr:hypothetical protein [Polyangiaceae bacterium]
MRSLLLRRIYIQSPRERRARMVELDRKVTVIQGENRTGKSSLIRTIWHCFGASPSTTSSRWERAATVSAVEFAIDDRDYTVLRNGDTIALFAGRDQLIRVVEAGSPECSEYFSQFFGYGLMIPSAGASVPPPAYMYLPYYIDQDKSWIRPWTGLKIRSAISGLREELVDFHVGLKPNAYYEYRARETRLEADLHATDAQLKVISKTYTSIGDRFDGFVVEFDQFTTEVDEILQRCRNLQAQDDAFKEKLVNLNNRKMAILAQVDVVGSIAKELHLDYLFAMGQVAERIECPLCGASCPNTMASRASLAQDEDVCLQIATRLRSDLIAIEREIAKTQASYQRNAEELSRVQELLDRRKKEITLKDLIAAEGKKELRARLKTEIDSLSQGRLRLAAEIEDCRRWTRSAINKQLRKDILKDYRELFSRHLDSLDVSQSQRSDMFTSLTPSFVEGTGSEKPRISLAYAYTLLHLIRKRPQGVVFPVVIDSPNQSDQDAQHRTRIFRFIRDALPSETQLILGTMSTWGVNFGGRVENLDTKDVLLRDDQYDKVVAVLRPLQTKVWALRPLG